MDPSDAPGFLEKTFLWTEGGYYYSAPPPGEALDSRAVDSRDPWLSLAAALECAKRGQNGYVGRLQRWLGADVESGVIQSCIALIGDAALEADLTLLIDVMQPSTDEYWRLKACEAAVHAGNLDLVPDILDVAHTVRRVERGTLSLYLSWLLDAPGELEVGDELAFEEDREYVAFVKARATSLALAHAGTKAFWQGQPLDVEALARRMLHLLTPGANPSERAAEFVALRHRFEACTGVDCRAMFVDGELRPIAAAALLERFLKTTDLRRFVPGQRYFWGRPIA